MRKRVSKIVLVTLCTVSLLLIGATAALGSEDDRFGGTLSVALSAEPPNLDWQVETSTNTRIVGSHIFENLITWNQNYQLAPQLASDWEISENNQEFTFYLREGVQFHNGKEMTAEDVKASIERFLKVSQRKGDLDYIESINILDPYTIKIETSRPARLPTQMAIPQASTVIMPKEVVEGKGVGELSQEDLIGTGPFKFVEWNYGENIKLERFEDYQPPSNFDEPSGLTGNRKAYLDELLFYFVPDPGARASGLRAGRFGFIDQVPYSEYESLKKSSKFNIATLSPYNYTTHYINKTNAPLDDWKLRRAILAAVNQEAVQYSVTSGNPELARLESSLFFEAQKTWNTDIIDTLGLYNQNNPELARELIEASGYDNEEIIIATTKDRINFYRTSVVIQEQLSDVGLNAKLRVYDFSSLIDIEFSPGRLDDWHLGAMTFTPRFDPSAYYYTFENGDYGYHNAAVNELVEKDKETFDREKRVEIWEEIQKLIYEDGAFLRSVDIFKVQGFTNKVKGYDAWYIPKFWNVWLEE